MDLTRNSHGRDDKCFADCDWEFWRKEFVY